MSNNSGKQMWVSVFLCVVALAVGVSSGILWYSFRNGEVVRPIERKLIFELLIDDKNCDSGISRDWFDGAYLVNESREKIQTLTNVSFDLDCSKDSEILRVSFVIEPTTSPNYRLVLFKTQEKSRDHILELAEVVTGDDFGFTNLLDVISADCSIKERLCN